MKKLPFCLAAGLSLLALSTTAAGTVELWVDGVSMTFDVPDGWKVEKNVESDGDHLVNAALKAGVMPKPTPGDSTQAKYNLPEVSRGDALQQSLLQGFGPMVEQITSEKPEPRSIPGSDPEAFYITARQPGGRYTIVGITYLQDTEIVMMGSSADEGGIADVLAVMATVKIGKAED